MFRILLGIVACSFHVHSFVVPHTTERQNFQLKPLHADADEKKMAPMVTGAELEVMLQEMETPLIVDAYATWCGPCVLMAPEFEDAAKDLKGKVRMVKLDTDQEEDMAAKLQIMGLPTLLFLDKYEPPEGEEAPPASVVLKGRIEGAMEKKHILGLAEHYFFDGPEPDLSFS